MIDSSILEEIGLSKGESKVYFALLDLDGSSIGNIARKSGITPAKVYIILDKLVAKGLATSIIKFGTKYFEAAHPREIIKYLDDKHKKIESEKKIIKKLIPDIEAKQRLSKDQQKAEVYQGFSGLKTLYNEIIETLKESGEDFISFTLGKEEYEQLEAKSFFREYDTKRRNNKIKLKLIGSLNQKRFMDNIVKGDRNISIKYINYQVPTGTIIFGNKVAILTWKEQPTAFVIQSNNTAQAYKKFFFDMWKIAKN